MRRLRWLAVSSLLGLAACFDFSYSGDSGGGDATGASSAQGPTGAASGAGAATSTSTSGASTVSASASAASTSTGGATSSGSGGSGGGGGTGGGCIPGEGDPGDVEPFSFSLGPLRGVGPYASMATALDGERLVVATTSFPDPGGSAPVLFDDVEVTDGTVPEYLLAWIDDGGTARNARRLTSDAPPAAAITANIDVAAGRAGKVILALSHLVAADGVVTLVEYDLCTDEETVLARCSAPGLQQGSVDADPSGRIAASFYSNYGTIECDPIPPGCLVPPLAGPQDSFVWQLRPDGTCDSSAIVNPDEVGEVISVQSRVSPVLAPDDALLMIGSYDGFLFEGASAIGTEEPDPYFYPDAVDPSVFHDFVARFASQGGTLELRDARDLGRAGNGGRQVVPFGNGGFVLATTVQTNIEPASEFEPPLDLPGGLPGSSHLLLAAIDVQGKTLWGGWASSEGEDAVNDLSRTASGMMIAGNSTHLGGCTDNTNEGRCAVFATLSDQGDLGDPLVVDAMEGARGDLGVGAYALPSDQAWIVGASRGTVVLDRELPAPTAETTIIYGARVVLDP